MAVTPSQFLVTDDLTILLGLISATVFLLHTFYRPQPLVHPILLGRQSDVARVRNPGESAVYRNYGTGLMGRFSLRPNKDVHVLADLVRNEQDSPRTLWNTKISNATLQDRVAAFGTGLLRLAGLQNGHADAGVLLLLNDCIEFLIADMALASHSILSLTITDSTLVGAVLDSHPPAAIIAHADLLPHLLEMIYEAHEKENGKGYTIIVVGEPSARTMASVASKVNVLLWSHVEREGVRVEKTLSPVPKPSDIFSISFFSDESGQLQAVQFTHENLTAGVAATRALLPMAHSLNSLDTIVSSHSLSTAYGRSIAYAAIFEGTSFATLESSKLFPSDEVKVAHDVVDILSAQKYPIPSPTIMFMHSGNLISLVDAVLEEAKRNWLSVFAWRHKVSGIVEGFITKDSLWDRLVYDGARAKVIGEGAGTVRAVVVGGGPLPASILTAARVALSVPFVNMFTHPSVAGPVFASHPLDLQDFYGYESPTTSAANDEIAPVGPPSVNIEAKVTGLAFDEAVESGMTDPDGVLLVRGPPVGKLVNPKLVNVEGYVNVNVPSPTGGEEDDRWVGTGVRASVGTNGAFRIL
ncbi:hypothetical protein E1B28_008658 [Marasmius oreades]|uniref:AMP-dependent synthetase/ligase domain-containing protein n=1 Tax=Marasmius oreades TaxID=181124 RepID=A0A9P7UTI1_9AGAR|nr:uncharacterized protein E1B28_008658 [Marasmius oreades]KAG7092296.1 hypothetical protein E1B28_008658 [Marasmius oreades]